MICGNCNAELVLSKKRKQRLRKKNQNTAFCGHRCSELFQKNKVAPQHAETIEFIIKKTGSGEKTCSKCDLTKDLSNFHRKSATCLNSYCKSCVYQCQMRRWNKNKIRAIEYLGGMCKTCRIIDHPSVYDFHHLRDKKAEWAKLRQKSWDKIKAELDKCVLLCSNCHRKTHINQDLWKTI